MKCEKCNVEMEKGWLVNGMRWHEANESKMKDFLSLLVNHPVNDDSLNLLAGKSSMTFAWRCPKCKILTLQTVENSSLF